MASTVYLVENGYIRPSRPAPLDSSWINRKLMYRFHSDDISRIPGNKGIVCNNDKLWIAIRNIFQKQNCFVITCFFEEPLRGRELCIRVAGPFLEKLKDVYEDFNALKLNLTLRHQSKSWSIDIGLNNIRRNKGILRTVHSQRSQQLFRRISALQDLQVVIKLTTRVNALHTRRVMGRNLFAENTPFDFHLISENGKRIGFHRNLLAAHSNVFGCPSVQSMDAMQLFVSDCTLSILKNYVYSGLVIDVESDQQMAFELLEAAHFYNIVGLERIMKKKLLALLDTPGKMRVDLAVLLCFFANKVEIGYKQLGEKALALIQNTTCSEIDKSEAFQYILMNDKQFDDFLRTSVVSEGACSMEE
ncbi:unnamed protein product [Orchesella dallaii]|uniref:BTB domain-containing protein n=1 Tax=Orchesella dallaii TaxID=48710 RepID=A0ABP1RAH4_9HEXA